MEVTRETAHPSTTASFEEPIPAPNAHAEAETRKGVYLGSWYYFVAKRLLKPSSPMARVQVHWTKQ